MAKQRPSRKLKLKKEKVGAAPSARKPVDDNVTMGGPPPGRHEQEGAAKKALVKKAPAKKAPAKKAPAKRTPKR